MRTLEAVATALDKGDLAYATLLTQFMRLPSLPDYPSFQRPIEADSLLKAGFNPNQLRDSNGRWAPGGGQGSSHSGAAGNDNSSGIQYVSAVCTNCHAVVPPIPPVWQGPFDDLLFGPQLTRPDSQADGGFHDALMACHQVCLDRYIDDTLGGPPGIGGSDQPSHYRQCMRECLSAKGYENF